MISASYCIPTHRPSRKDQPSIYKQPNPLSRLDKLQNMSCSGPQQIEVSHMTADTGSFCRQRIKMGNWDTLPRIFLLMGQRMSCWDRSTGTSSSRFSRNSSKDTANRKSSSRGCRSTEVSKLPDRFYWEYMKIEECNSTHINC